VTPNLTQRDLLQEVYFASWRHNFVDVDNAAEPRVRKRAKTFPADNYFASWRHHLDADAGSERVRQKACSPENWFSVWRKIFDDPACRKSTAAASAVAEEDVDIFSDWMPNLFDDDEDPELQPDDHRLLKNKKRIARKSNNLKRKRHF
jgi:hypothetical protein